MSLKLTARGNVSVQGIPNDLGSIYGVPLMWHGLQNLKIESWQPLAWQSPFTCGVGEHSRCCQLGLAFHICCMQKIAAALGLRSPAGTCARLLTT